MRIENIINLWDPLQRGNGIIFILFGCYIYKEYMTLELVNFRINISFERD